jgi:hypothetical protein
MINIVEVAGDQALTRHLALERLAPARIAELLPAFGYRAGGRVTPCFGIVEEVPVLEGESQAHVGRDAKKWNCEFEITPLRQKSGTRRPRNASYGFARSKFSISAMM